MKRSNFILETELRANVPTLRYYNIIYQAQLVKFALLINPFKRINQRNPIFNVESTGRSGNTIFSYTLEGKDGKCAFYELQHFFEKLIINLLQRKRFNSSKIRNSTLVVLYIIITRFIRHPCMQKVTIQHCWTVLIYYCNLIIAIAAAISLSSCLLRIFTVKIVFEKSHCCNH